MKKSETFNLRIDSDVMEKIRHEAKKEQRTIANMIRLMINEYLSFTK